MLSKKTKIIGGSVLGALALGVVLTPTVIAPSHAAWATYQILIGDEAVADAAASLESAKAIGSEPLTEYKKMQEFFKGEVPFEKFIYHDYIAGVNESLDEADQLPVGGWVNAKLLGGEKLRAENLTALAKIQTEADPYYQAGLSLATMDNLCEVASGEVETSSMEMFWTDMKNFSDVDFSKMASYCDNAKPEVVEKYDRMIDEEREAYKQDPAKWEAEKEAQLINETENAMDPTITQ